MFAPAQARLAIGHHCDRIDGPVLRKERTDSIDKENGYEPPAL
jgi:hypothetical protein